MLSQRMRAKDTLRIWLSWAASISKFFLLQIFFCFFMLPPLNGVFLWPYKTYILSNNTVITFLSNDQLLQ